MIEYVNIVLVLHHMKDPSFLPKQKKANEIGTLMHTVMQHLPLENNV